MSRPRTAVGTPDEPDLYATYRVAWQSRMQSVRRALIAAGRIGGRR